MRRVIHTSAVVTWPLALILSIMPVGAGINAATTAPADPWRDTARYYQRPAEAGDANAQFTLGMVYERGLGVPADPALARQWYEKAARQREPRAILALGLMLARGPAADQAAARDWLALAAQAGAVEAQLTLGTLLDSGMGGAADAAGARRWYGMAAAQGEARARNNLALLLAEGRGGEADVDAARKLLEQAAAQGFAPAFLNLGRLMASASPESRDLIGAVAWLALAADRGDAATAQAAQADRKIVEQAMSDEEKAAVAARVAQLGAKLPS